MPLAEIGSEQFISCDTSIEEEEVKSVRFIEYNIKHLQNHKRQFLLKYRYS